MKKHLQSVSLQVFGVECEWMRAERSICQQRAEFTSKNSVFCALDVRRCGAQSGLKELRVQFVGDERAV